MRRGVLWALLLSFLLAGCAPAGAPAGEGSGQEPSQSAMAPAPEAGTSAQPQPAPEPEPPTQEELLQAMVDTMTPEEKAGQLFWVRFPETGWDELAREWHPGGFLLFGRDFKNRTPEELRTLLASLQETSPHPLLLGVDEEGARWSGPATTPPSGRRSSAPPRPSSLPEGWRPSGPTPWTSPPFCWIWALT